MVSNLHVYFIVMVAGPNWPLPNVPNNRMYCIIRTTVVDNSSGSTTLLFWGTSLGKCERSTAWYVLCIVRG